MLQNCTDIQEMFPIHTALDRSCFSSNMCVNVVIKSFTCFTLKNGQSGIWKGSQLWTVHFQLSWYRCCVPLKYSTMITEDWQCHHKTLLFISAFGWIWTSPQVEVEFLSSFPSPFCSRMVGLILCFTCWCCSLLSCFKTVAQCQHPQSGFKMVLNLWLSETELHKWAGCFGSVYLSAASGHVCNSVGYRKTNHTANELHAVPLCPFRIEFLRHIRDFFQIMFKIDVQKTLDDERKGGDKVLMTCVGVGYSNLNKTLK